MKNQANHNSGGSSVSRRAFLKASAAFAAFPCIIPASALGKDGRPAPSERIVMGGIGIGNQGSGDLSSFLGRNDVQYVAICDVKQAVREGAKGRIDRHNKDTGCTAYSDFREILARKDLDAVHVATPDHWHAIIVIEACRQGKDVYCQKPESLTIHEGRAMVQAARRYGRVVSGGSQRVMGDYMDTVRQCWSGEAGEIKEVYVNCGGPSEPCYLPGEPVPAGLDWDMWLGPAPARGYNHQIHPFSWRDFRDYSGGYMTDWGAHHFDIAQWGLGMDESGPAEIHPPGAQGPTLTYVYGNGVRMYHLNSANKEQQRPTPAPFPDGDGILFVGEDGTVFVNRGKLVTTPSTLATHPIGPNDVRLYRSPGHQRDFLNCIHTRQRPCTDVEIGARSVTVCHLGNIAYWLGRSLKWDPVKEQFIGDEAANRWLDRPKRAPWIL
jgi:predicted dehydrogenase